MRDRLARSVSPGRLRQTPAVGSAAETRLLATRSIADLTSDAPTLMSVPYWARTVTAASEAVDRPRARARLLRLLRPPSRSSNAPAYPPPLAGRPVVEKWSTATLVRMVDTVEAAMRLMEAGLEVDARTLLRSLYEQVVTFAWLRIDPGPRFSRWFGDGLLEELRLHNDAQPFGITILEEDELADTKRLLKLTEEDEAPREPDCTGKHKRTSNKLDAALVLPPVPQRASEADKHWAGRIAGLHPHRYPFGFAGLYLLCFRVAGRSVHPTMNALHPYITETPPASSASGE